MIRNKSFYFIVLLSVSVMAQKGPFLKISVGPGIMNEYKTIHGSGFTMVAKNHAIGWGFENKCAVSYSEFGAFVRKNTGAKDRYVNLDAYGMGLSVRARKNFSCQLSAAYGTVHFSDRWNKQGDFIEDGYAAAFGAGRNWLLSKRIEVGAGPQAFVLKTKTYLFTDFSFNLWLDLYLFPQR